MRNLYLISFVLGLTACVHSSVKRHPSADETSNLTVWELQDMSKTEQGRRAIDEMFEGPGDLDATVLPTGPAAGAGASVFNINFEPLDTVLKFLVKDNWKGKVFFPSADGQLSMGLNRIANAKIENGLNNPEQSDPNYTVNVDHIASFVTYLQDRGPGRAKMVILNYSEPRTEKSTWHELLLDKWIEVYDVMVPVKGKYGTIYLGKTWQGHYNPSNHKFTANNPDKLIARFYLDFNPGALAAQHTVDHWNNTNVWDGDEPVPAFDHKKLPKGFSLETMLREVTLGIR
jgi:hypothetical protein